MDPLKEQMMHALVEQDELEIEFFKENNVREVNRYFRRRQCITITMCVAALILSQADLKLSTDLLTDAINKEGSVAMTQTIHMATALFLFALGAFLEYSRWLDWIIFVITCTVILAKSIQGYEKLRNLDEHGSLQKIHIYDYIPYEIVFPICNSIKYV